MLHPIYTTLLRRPELVADHVVNYAALVREEGAQAGRTLVGRLIAVVLAALSAVLALGLAGVALMLGAMHGEFHWVLVAVPLALALLALGCGWAASRPTLQRGFEDLRIQLEADLQALRRAGAPDGRG